MRVAARLEGVPLPSFVRARARTSAKIDVPGVYAPLLKTASVQVMASRLPRIFSRYFAPIEVSVVESADDHLRVRFPRIPEPMVGWYVWSNEGFMGKALELAGARAPRIDTVEVAPDGALEQIPLRAVTQLASW